MEPVNCDSCIWKGLLYDSMHTFREIHSNLHNSGSLEPQDVLKSLHYAFHLGTFDNGYNETLATMGILVGDYGVKFNIR